MAYVIVRLFEIWTNICPWNCSPNASQPCLFVSEPKQYLGLHRTSRLFHHVFTWWHRNKYVFMHLCPNEWNSADCIDVVNYIQMKNIDLKQETNSSNNISSEFAVKGSTCRNRYNQQHLFLHHFSRLQSSCTSAFGLVQCACSCRCHHRPRSFGLLTCSLHRQSAWHHQCCVTCVYFWIVIKMFLLKN